MVLTYLVHTGGERAPRIIAGFTSKPNATANQADDLGTDELADQEHRRTRRQRHDVLGADLGASAKGRSMRFWALIGCAAAALASLAYALPATAADAGCYVESVSTSPAPKPISEILNGRPTLRYLPPHPKGVVYFFHGSGGSERFAARLHSQRLLAALVAAGYGYVSPPSLDRDAKRWNLASADPASNPDVAWVLSLHRTLIARGEITSVTPVFATGMSNGGGFANLFAAAAKAQGLPVAAVADYMGPSRPLFVPWWLIRMPWRRHC